MTLSSVPLSQRRERAAHNPHWFEQFSSGRLEQIRKWNVDACAMRKIMLRRPPRPSGPLWGTIFAAKENFEVRGEALTLGTKHVVRIGSTDSELIEQLLELGATFVGTTVMDPLALFARGRSEPFGEVLNPKFPSRRILGSSCGSASSVASGLIDFALGTDFGGSIRAPAAAAHIYGFKSAFGSLSSQGVELLDAEMDCIGLVCDDLELLQIVMNAIENNSGCRSTFNGTFKILEGTFDSSSPLWNIDEKSRPTIRFDLEHLAQLRKNIASVAVAQYLDSLSIPLDETTRAIVNFGKTSRARALADEAAIERIAILHELRAAIGQHEVVLLPALSSPPPLRSQKEDRETILRLTPLFLSNLLGAAAATFPLRIEDGIGESVQVLGWSNQVVLEACDHLRVSLNFALDLAKR